MYCCCCFLCVGDEIVANRVYSSAATSDRLCNRHFSKRHTTLITIGVSWLLTLVPCGRTSISWVYGLCVCMDSRWALRWKRHRDKWRKAKKTKRLKLSIHIYNEFPGRVFHTWRRCKMSTNSIDAKIMPKLLCVCMSNGGHSVESMKLYPTRKAVTVQSDRTHTHTHTADGNTRDSITQAHLMRHLHFFVIQIRVVWRVTGTLLIKPTPRVGEVNCAVIWRLPFYVRALICVRANGARRRVGTTESFVRRGAISGRGKSGGPRVGSQTKLGE